MSMFLTKWAVLSIALAATAWLLPGVHVSSVGALLVAAIALGFLNAVLKPLLVLLTLPLTIVTLGIFYFVLNAVLFALGSVLVPGFTVDGFGWAFVGALVMGILSTVLASLLGPADRHHGSAPRDF
jgi:putative membrane protein